MIPRVLNLCNSGTLDKLCIRLVFPNYDPYYTLDAFTDKYVVPYPQGVVDCVKNTIVYAATRKVKILDLNFNARCTEIDNIHSSKLYDLSDHHVLVSDHLTDLRLTTCCIASCGDVDLKSLRVLYLNEVSLSDATMDRVLLGCPLLEDLSLVNCLSLGSLTCSNPKLRKLMIARKKCDVGITRVACPYVLRLEITGCVSRVVLSDASSVVDVTIHVSSAVSTYDIGGVGSERALWELMQKTSHCRIFKCGGRAVEELSMCGRRFLDWPSFRYKSLVLEMSLRMENQPGIALLLRNSQSLETLTLHFHTKEYHKSLGDYFCAGAWETFNRGASYRNATFPSLMAINVYGDIHSRYALELVRALLRCAIGL